MSDSGNPISRLRMRLEQLSRSGEEVFAYSERTREAVLRARAQALAAPVASKTARPTASAAILFRLGDERFALPLEFVREVGHLPPIAHLPGVPAFVAGVVHLRGEMVCVYDLHVLFGLPIERLSERTQLLVLGRERVEMAVLCDAVDEEIPIDLEQLLDVHQAAATDYVLGVTADATVVVDGAGLLDDPRLVVDDSEP